MNPEMEQTGSRPEASGKLRWARLSVGNTILTAEGGG